VSVLRPMTESEYVAWRAAAIPAYAADKVASGQWLQGESLDLSQKEYDELLPDGIKTADNVLFTIVDDRSAAVGVLWFAVKTRFGTRIAYVFDIAVEPERQREGHAHRALLALEEEARRAGLAGIALHVFGHNAGARALYEKLGFQPTSISLFKTVPTMPA
jgi:ribosomal protein S18 acetylase RimI-like enzyme